MFRKIERMAIVLREIAKGYAPKHLIPYVHTQVEVDESAGKAIIRLIADRNANPLQKWGSLDARAQEYGSGEHSSRGKKDLIPIVPVNGAWLVFKGTNEWEGKTVRTKLVRSPGIPMYKGEGYIRRAAREFKKQVIVFLDADIRHDIAVVFRESFGGRVNK